MRKKPTRVSFFGFFWSEYKDSNLGPPGPKPGALPDCATLRQVQDYSPNQQPAARCAELFHGQPSVAGDSAFLVLRFTEQDVPRLVVGDGTAQLGQHLDAPLHRGPGCDDIKPFFQVRVV